MWLNLALISYVYAYTQTRWSEAVS